jgi:hypothetical protein
LLNLLLQVWEIGLSCVPYDEKVNPEVSVNQSVPYPDHFVPGEFWMSVLQILGNMSCSFADNLHLADDPILQKNILQKAVIGNTSQVLLYAILSSRSGCQPDLHLADLLSGLKVHHPKV